MKVFVIYNNGYDIIHEEYNIDTPYIFHWKCKRCGFGEKLINLGKINKYHDFCDICIEEFFITVDEDGI